MGYVDNRHMSKFVGPFECGKTAGTWTPTLASNVASDVKTAADESFGVFIPINLPGSDQYHQGARLKSIDVYYEIATAAADDFATVELEKLTLPLVTGDTAGAAVTTTEDGGHDTAAERLAVDDHVMTVTVTTPEWVDEDVAFMLYLLVDAAATTVFTLYGARINYDIRL